MKKITQVIFVLLVFIYIVIFGFVAGYVNEFFYTSKKAGGIRAYFQDSLSEMIDLEHVYKQAGDYMINQDDIILYGSNTIIYSKLQPVINSIEYHPLQPAYVVSTNNRTDILYTAPYDVYVGFRINVNTNNEEVVSIIYSMKNKVITFSSLDELTNITQTTFREYNKNLYHTNINKSIKRED